MKMEDDILIEQFLRNTLSKEEKASFLERMKSDDAFKEQVQLEEQLLNTLGETYWSFARNDSHARVEAYEKLLESAETKQLKEKIAAAIQQYKDKQVIEQKPNRIFKLRFILRIAALFLIFFSIFWYFSKDEKIDYATLTANAWNKNVGLDFTLRSNPSDIIKMDLEKALNFYKIKQYDSTLIILEKYTASSNQYKDILILRALANYKLQKPKFAFSSLDSLKVYNPDVANWYKGLIHLDQKNHEKAALFLEIPSEPNKEIKLKQ